MEKLQSWPRKKKKCRAYISKDAQIKALKERNDESINDKEIILMQSKRINELKTSIEQLETFELDNIELKNANKLAHDRIKELERNIEQLEIELQ